MKPEDLLLGDDHFTPRVKGYFIGKPVPYTLMKRAMGLPGKAFAVYMALWVLFSAKKKREIRLQRRFFEGSGLAATSITRGIDELVKAWLIQEVHRKPGQTPILYLMNEKEVIQAEEALAIF